jgi:hypothetical protein
MVSRTSTTAGPGNRVCLQAGPRVPIDRGVFGPVFSERRLLEYRLPDKLKAVELDNDLAGDDSEAGKNDALAELPERVRK